MPWLFSRKDKSPNITEETRKFEAERKKLEEERRRMGGERRRMEDERRCMKKERRWLEEERKLQRQRQASPPPRIHNPEIISSDFSNFASQSSQSMELPFDILDHIFSFLRSDPKALFACSKAHPTLSQVVEKYRFHHIIIHTGVTDFTYSFKPFDLLRHLAKAPRIVNYVAVLQIEFDHYQYGYRMSPYLEEIASLLPMFPVLEAIMLPTPHSALLWQKFPQSFKTAVENCLHLPTLQEIHVGNMFFPLSMLDNHANINYFPLSGPPDTASHRLNLRVGGRYRVGKMIGSGHFSAFLFQHRSVKHPPNSRSLQVTSTWVLTSFPVKKLPSS